MTVDSRFEVAASLDAFRGKLLNMKECERQLQADLESARRTNEALQLENTNGA